MDLTLMLREQKVALRGTEHWRCGDPEYDWYDWVVVARALNGKPPGRRLSHAEQVAAVRAELGRGGSVNSSVGLLHIDDRTVRKLAAEADTGTCVYVARTCAINDCDGTFRAADPRAQYCSDACRNRRHAAVTTTTAAA